MKLKIRVILIFFAAINAVNTLSAMSSAYLYSLGHSKVLSREKNQSKASAVASEMASIKERVMSQTKAATQEFSKKSQAISHKLSELNFKLYDENEKKKRSESELSKLLLLKNNLSNVIDHNKVAVTQLSDIVANHESTQIDTFLETERETLNQNLNEIEVEKKEKKALAKLIKSQASSLQTKIIESEISKDDESKSFDIMNKMAAKLTRLTDKEIEDNFYLKEQINHTTLIESKHNDKHKEIYDRILVQLKKYLKTVEEEKSVLAKFVEINGTDSKEQLEFLKSSKSALIQLEGFVSEAIAMKSCKLNEKFYLIFKEHLRSQSQFNLLFSKKLQKTIELKSETLKNLNSSISEIQAKIGNSEAEKESTIQNIKLVQALQNEELQKLNLMKIQYDLSSVGNEALNAQTLRDLHEANEGADLITNDLSILNVSRKQSESHKLSEAIKETVSSVTKKHSIELWKLAGQKEDIIKEEKLLLSHKEKELAELEKKLKERDQSILNVDKQNKIIMNETINLQNNSKRLMTEITNKSNEIAGLETSNSYFSQSLAEEKRKTEALKFEIDEKKIINRKVVEKVSTKLYNQSLLIDELSSTLKAKSEKFGRESQIAAQRINDVKSLGIRVEQLKKQLRDQKNKVSSLKRINENYTADTGSN